jgi:hypothetical protein
MGKCTVDGCEKSSRRWQLCEAHAHKQRTYGDPLGTPIHRTSAERFWSKVDRDGPLPERQPELGACWLWLAGCFANGYGAFTFERRLVKAHRHAYEQLVGPIPGGLVIDHLCRNTGCVNPAHMEPVTNAVNLLRGEGIGARNLAKTHCKHGHEFTPENTYRFGPDNRYRSCRACAREKDRRARERRKAAA